jgi:hypothetical protein
MMVVIMMMMLASFSVSRVIAVQGPPVCSAQNLS